MKLISSKMTFVHKRVFPAIWFALVAVGMVGFLTGRMRDKSGAAAPPALAVIPIAMAAFAYLVLRKFVWDLADEAWDCGDHLLVKMAGREERIDLANVINVGWTAMTSPERITLSLREPSAIGREIVFMPAVRFALFSRSPIVDDLIDRVDAARRASRPADR